MKMGTPPPRSKWLLEPGEASGLHDDILSFIRAAERPHNVEAQASVCPSDQDNLLVGHCSNF